MKPTGGVSSRGLGRVAAIGAAAVLGLVPAGCSGRGAAAAPRPDPEVTVVEARRMDVPLLAEPNGTTRALQQVTLRARVRGFLREVRFTEGSDVKKGQLLFVIEEDTFQVAVASAKAKLASAEASLAKATESKARESSAARLALDKAQSSLARVEERRALTLFERNATARGDVDRAQADRERYDAQVQADQADLEQAKADYDTNIKAAQADVDAAKAAVRDAEINLGYCRVSAPIDGRIGEAKVKLGNLVGPSSGGSEFTDLATIQQLKPMGVDVQVSSRYLDRATRLIRQGLPVTIFRPGLEGEPDKPHDGKCFLIDNMIDSATSTFLVRAEVDNPEATLLPGEYVKVKIVIGQSPGAIVVPEAAVVETQAGPTVFTVGQDGVVAVKNVTAGVTYDGLRVIASGLEAGQRVIVDGIQLVRRDIHVKVKSGPAPAPVPDRKP